MLLQLWLLLLLMLLCVLCSLPFGMHVTHASSSWLCVQS
jgi:hypothetical protein